MRPYTKVIINSIEADLPPNFSFTLSYAIRDKEGFAVNTGTRSDYSFTLPATKINDRIARNFWHVGTVTESEQEFLLAEIEINGRPFFTGKAQLRKVDIKENPYYWKGDNYHYAFFGNNADWVVDSKNSFVKDLPFTAHTFNDATILTGWNAFYPSIDYGYALIKTKDWPLSSMVQFIDSTPVIFVAAIIDYHFANLGYTISSTFFNSLFFKYLVIPVLLPEKYGEDFSEDYINIFAEFSIYVPLATYSTITSIYNVQTQTPSVGPNPYSTVTGIYTVPYDGFYKIKGTYDIINVTGNVGFSGVIVINGVAPGPPYTFSDGAFFANITAPTRVEFDFIIPFSAGDTIEIVYVAVTASGNADVFGTLEITGEAEIKSGTTIDFEYLIPKQWKVLDVIKGLSHAFNLVWETDAATNTITVEPSDNYLYTDRTAGASVESGFYGASVADKNFKLDMLKGGEVKSNSYRPQQYILMWKEDSNDNTVQELNVNEELQLYAARYTMPENRFKSGIETIENPFFAATLQIADRTITHEDSTKTVVLPIIWPKDWNEEPTADEQISSYEPRLLVFEGLLSSTVGGLVRLSTGGGAYTSSQYPYCYFVDYNDESGTTIPLSFNNLLVNDVEQVGLLQRFYIRQFARYRVGKEVECFLMWTATDLNNLSFRELIDIRQDRFILQEVNAFNPMSDEATRTYLLYDAVDEAADFDAIDGSLVDGKLVQYVE